MNNTLFNLLCIFGFCFPVLLTFGVLGYKLVDTLRARESAQRLGDELGWQPPAALVGTKDHARWRTGVTHERQVLIVNTAERNNNTSHEGIRYQVVLRVIMALNVPQPLGLHIFRKGWVRGSQPSFEELFFAKDGRFPPQSIQQAMLQFVQLGYPTGLRRGGALRFSAGWRNLKLADRRGLDIGTKENPLIPDANAVLVYTHPEPNLPVEEFLTLLNELSTVAEAVEVAAQQQMMNDGQFFASQGR